MKTRHIRQGRAPYSSMIFIEQNITGGHSDVYLPHGQDLDYYDVHSLYPFVMKNYPMPIVKPQWTNASEVRLKGSRLRMIKSEKILMDSLKHTLSALNQSLILSCPTEMRQMVAHWETGQFMGVYYSEE